MIDFINGDHKEMHEVLLQKGFTCEHNAKWHPTSAIWDFVYEKGMRDASWFIVFEESSEKVKAIVYSGQEYTCDVPKLETLNGKTFKEVTAYFTQNEPTMENAQPTSGTITRDNIEATLKYNNIDSVEVISLGLSLPGIFYISMDKCPNWLEMLESFTGKLTPPPQTLTEYWATNKRDGWELTKMNDYWYTLSAASAIPIVLAYIPTTECPFYKGTLTEQVALLNKLIEAYSIGRTENATN